jgi:uncharacterized protein involved in exopolysaccharide biosynthesis
MNLDSFGPIWRHKRMILLVILSAVINTVVLTYVITEKYKATALVLLRPQAEVDLVGAPVQKEVLSFPIGGGGQSTENSSRTITELIKTREIAATVVRNLRLHERKRAPDPNPWKELWKSSKEKARDLLADAGDLLKYGRIIEVPPFDSAVDRVHAGLAAALKKNTYIVEITYLGQDGEVVAAVANEASKVFVQTLSDLSTQEATRAKETVSVGLKQATAELMSSRKAMQDFKERNRHVLFKEETSERLKSIAELESRLERTEAELSGVLKQFTPENPKVVRLQGERDRMAATVAAMRRDLRDLPAGESRLAALELDIKTAENIVSVLSKDFEEARIREDRRNSGISVVSPAVVPRSPVKPIKIYNVGVALALALIASVACAYVLESANTTLRSIDEVVSVLGLPVLATIPASLPTSRRLTP